jgi:molecular chaperone GrpE
MENNDIEKPLDAVADAVAEQPTPTANTADELAGLRAELDKAKSDAAANLDGWQRARAEFANFKKRNETQNIELRAFATQQLVAKLLPVLDDFDRATKSVPEPLQHMTWIEGVLLIQRKLGLILESEGAKPIEVRAGEVFNPSLHEAIMQDDAPEGSGIESGQIIEVIQNGYKIGERVIRPALVRVAK